SDTSNGLANTQRDDGTDGENDPTECGPASDVRSGRRNKGGSDNDAPDAYTYFVVTRADVKASTRLRISATFFDDPAFAAEGAAVEVRLEYTNRAATGREDAANTRAVHPAALRLRGSGSWVRHRWNVSDAGFRTLMEGTSDFRFHFGGAHVCIDRVDVATDPEPVSATEHLIAAQYYPWYTARRWDYVECSSGAVRLDLDPPQPPALGRYDSSDAAVVDQHLRWCAEHGVNVLVLEFTRPGSREDRVSRTAILQHPRIGDVQVALLYDWAIRFNNFQVTPERIAAARADFDYLAREYFPHPSYLKVRGELPLVMIYVTRALKGEVRGLVDGLREACATRGFEVFLVGDEFFFPSAPSNTRIARWDGIFGYDVYASRGGSWGSNGSLAIFQQRSAEYRQAAEALGVKYFPSCAPGFNDRAIRRTCEDHPALARRLTESSAPTSLFEATFVRTALREVDAEVPLVSITSFNEWHEDTQIEPTRGGSGSTARDKSAGGTAYTQGLEHDDYGLEFLELIRDATIAYSGQVLGPDGPVAGARVEVLDGETTVLVRRSFSTGIYTVPRLRLTPGKSYRIRAASGASKALSPPTAALDGKTVTGLDLKLAPSPLPDRSRD
ncbi:MAG TPA: hypothetical protein VFD71_12855, partial [Planctomycetota bacterium]|nr:hypothetical protein [Planctomycetota bacterium]